MKSGAAAFDDYYKTHWLERWGVLREALVGEHRYVAITPADGAPSDLAYFLDPASVAIASLLPLPPEGDVLDMCAAPGGKSLVLALRLGQALETQRVALTVNERSATRRARLRSVMDAHLAPSLRSGIDVTGHDASRWGLHRPRSCHAVLADVPCSSERHLLADSTHLAQWSAARTRRLAVKQTAILAAAVDSTVAGGWILYSTCALSSRENDEVVMRVADRRPGITRVVSPKELASRINAPAVVELPPLDAEITTSGVIVLPDRSNGAGPLYGALIEKIG